MVTENYCMKNVLLGILCLSGIATMAQETATLKGRIIGVEGEMAYISHYKNVEGRFTRVIVDSCKFEDGKFELKVELDSLSQFTFNDGNENAYPLLKPGAVLELNTHANYFDEALSYKGDGADMNNAMANLYRADEMSTMPIFMKMDSRSGIDTTAMFEEIDEAIDKVTQMHEDYLVMYPELAFWLERDIKGADKKKASYKNYVRQEFLLQEIEKDIIGKPFISLEGIGVDGKTLNLEEFKGKPVLLDFWATWCGPCKAEFPDLLRVEDEYGSKVNVVGIGLWCKEDEWRAMVKDKGFSHGIFMAKGTDTELRETYMLNSIPRYMLLDKDLNIVSIRSSRPSSGKLEGELDAVLTK